MQMFKRFVSSALLIAVIAGALVALWNKQAIFDWYRLRDYNPSAEIVALVEHTAMSDYGKKLFYVHDPQLENRKEFNKSCTHFEQTIVLGCYITHRSIHIFDVQDERLQGIREVTAAHEMLHAAYDRLDESAKKEVDQMVVTYYEKIKKNHPRIRETVLGYIERDPTVANNELHSILATEVRELTPELEKYYAQYFDDRQKVVDYAVRYEKVFTQQQQKIKSLKKQIQQLETALQGKRAEIESEGQALQSESQRLANLRANNQTEEYNAAVPGYNQRVNAYRSTIQSFNNDIQRLNSLIGDYNELAVQQKELNSAIDSRAQTL